MAETILSEHHTNVEAPNLNDQDLLRLHADAPRAEVESEGRNHREPLWRHMLGDRLRGIRHERGETLGGVARRAGVSPQYLSEIERGLKEPSSEMIAAVTRALGITLVDLTLDIAESLIATQSHSSSQVSDRRSVFALAA